MLHLTLMLFGIMQFFKENLQYGFFIPQFFANSTYQLLSVFQTLLPLLIGIPPLLFRTLEGPKDIIEPSAAIW